MDIEIKCQLPAPVQRLVDEIEAAAGTEIILRKVPDLPQIEEGRGYAVGMRMETRIGDRIPAEDRYQFHLTMEYQEDPAMTYRAYPEPYAAFTHELLHVRRQFVDKVPVVYRVAHAPLLAREMESILEHLVIDRQVLNYGFDYPLSFSCREFWDNASKEPLQRAHESGFQWQLFCQWVTVQFLNSNVGIQKLAERVLERYGLERELRRITNELRWLLESPDPAFAKEAMVLTVCKGFRIPPADVTLFDVHVPQDRPITRSFSVPTATGELRQFQW